MPSREQRRAKFALEKVESVKEHAARTKYKTQLLKLPARLHSNGLGQTVAFYLSAGKDAPEVQICGWLQSWLREVDVYEQDRLIDGITKGDEAAYRLASAEARALSLWLKRFAEAFLEGDPA